MKSKLLTILLTSLVLVGCSNKNSNSENQGQNQGQNQPTPGGEPYTCEILLSVTNFAKDFSSGTNFGAGQSSNDAKLINQIKTQLENENCLTSLELISCAVREYDSNLYFQVSTGKPTNFNQGSFTWKSAVNIASVSVTCMNYANPYQDYQTGQTVPNVDSDGKLLINDQQYTLELETNGMPKENTFTANLSEGSKQFTLSSTGGRMLISKLSISWRP